MIDVSTFGPVAFTVGGGVRAAHAAGSANAPHAPPALHH